MAITQYRAKVREGRLLELPEEAGSLGLRPGEEVNVIVDRAEAQAPQTASNEKALAALREIARRQEGRRHTDGSQTERILREGRGGAMYDSDPAE